MDLPAASTFVRVRLEDLQRQQLDRLHVLTGLPIAELMRRCLRFYEQQRALEGAAALEIAPQSRLSSARRSGRKPRRQKISELERSIERSLRELEQSRRALEALKDGHAVPDFSKSTKGLKVC